VPANVCPPLDVYPDQLTFKKNSELLDYPVNRHTLDPGLSYNGDDDAGYEFRKADSGQTICGKMPRYVGESEPMMFCNNCGCVGQVDAFKYTQGIPERHYVEGMGIV